jgi:hypothetical protein
MPATRPSHLALCLLCCGGALFVASFADAARLRQQRAGAGDEMRGLVRQLQLTDLCLFTEARYTRHPSQADLHSPFQDHPLAFEHFPSGSLLLPPAILSNRHERLDRKAEVPD